MTRHEGIQASGLARWGARLVLLSVLVSMLALPMLARAGAADDAARRVAAQYGGRVLKVEDKGESYRIKLLLPSGQVKVVLVPGQGGGTPVGGDREDERKGDATQSKGGFPRSAGFDHPVSGERP